MRDTITQCAAAALTLLCVGWVASGAQRLQVETQDGLVLSLGRNGAFEMFQVDGRNVLSAKGQSGFWIRDIQTGTLDRFMGHVEFRGRGLSFIGYAKKAGVKISMDFLPEDAAIRLKGSVESLEPRERAVDLLLRLDCDAHGSQWPRDVQVSYPIMDIAPSPNTAYPFHGLVFPRNRAAFGMAVAPEEPALFEFAYEQNTSYILTLKYGLSQYASGRLRNRANFNVLLYRTDPEWGFRSVADRYYRLHERWFTRRANKNGMWLFYRPNAEEVPNPWDYAYHADIKVGWKEDKRQGVANLAYHLPGQREFVKLSKMPKTYEDQMKVMEESTQKYSRHISPDSIYQGLNLDRRLVASSGLHDSQGKLRGFTRDTEWGGSSLTFILNPSPNLYNDRPDVTMGKLSLEWARWKLDSIREMDGLMIDSLFGWGRYFNCRRDHFPYAAISLTYDPESKSPAISNQFSHQEYLWALRGLLNSRGKILMGNGIRPGRFFNGMELDVLTCENPVGASKEDQIMGADTVGGGEKEEVGLISSQFRNLIFDRVAAYRKPFLVVDHHPNEWNDIATVEYFWKVGLFFGVYPGFNWRYQIDPAYYEKHKAIINRYLPPLKQINAVGWDPITLAASDNRNVWIERYGDIQRGLFFTVMNVSDAKQTTTLTLQAEPLNLADEYKAVELIGARAAPIMPGAKIQVELAPHDVRLIQIAH